MCVFLLEGRGGEVENGERRRGGGRWVGWKGGLVGGRGGDLKDGGEGFDDREGN